MDVLGELHLLIAEVTLRICAELLGQDQDAVERRAQLVGHVGQKFGLVLRGQRQLSGFFLQGISRLLDLSVLTLHFGVLLGELLGFRCQFLVGLLQLFLLHLQLGRLFL